MTTSSSSDVMEIVPGVVFLSHASQDSDMAVEIHRLLKHEGVPVWMAAQEIKPGANYADTIFKTLTLSKAVIVILTKNSIASEHVRREVNIAIDKKIKLFPVNLSGVDDIVPILPAAWKYWLSITQILTCKDAQTAANTLLGLIGKEGEELEFVNSNSYNLYSLPETARNWMEKAGAEIKLLMNDNSLQSQFDFKSFHLEFEQNLGCEIQHLAASSDLDNIVWVGEFLNITYINFASPSFVINSKEWGVIIETYLMPAAVHLSHPDAILNFSDALIEIDPSGFLDFVKDRFTDDKILKNASLASSTLANQYKDETPLWRRTYKNYKFATYLCHAYSLRAFATLLGEQNTLSGRAELLDKLNSLEESVASTHDLNELTDDYSAGDNLRIWYSTVTIIRAYLTNIIGFANQAKDQLSEMDEYSTNLALNLLQDNFNRSIDQPTKELFHDICTFIENNKVAAH